VATIWQQIIRISEISTILKQNKHSKRRSGEVLMAQLRDYHTHQSPYNASYDFTFDIPTRWWETRQINPPYLQLLATKLFSVSPHAASCERVWSVCGWIYGTRRTRILVENLDAIAQIHSYYIANNKSELSYYGTGQSEEEIRQILRDADLYEEEEEITLDDVIFNADLNKSSIDDDSEIINEEPLELEDTLNLTNLRFLQNAEEHNNKNDDNSVDLDEWLVDFDQEEDYNPAELAGTFFRRSQSSHMTE